MGNDYRNGNSGKHYGNSQGSKDYGKPDDSYVPEGVAVKTFYTSDGKTIEPNLFDSTAKKIAESFTGKDKGKTIGVTSTQLRRIFDEVKRFEQILSADTQQWEKQLPYIKMIKSKVAYTVARAAKTKPAARKVYKNLDTFISSSIDLIKQENDYMAFLSLFEAVYGFYYEKAPKD